VANQVLCVNKSDRVNPYERIAYIGGVNANGQRWRITQDEAIEGIESGKWHFYVRVAYRDLKVIVAVSPDGRKYLKAETDGYQPDNLLRLPECPR
jgi:hypothetical protein